MSHKNFSIISNSSNYRVVLFVTAFSICSICIDITNSIIYQIWHVAK